MGTLARLALEIDDTRLYPLTHALITNKRTGNQCHRGQDAEDLLKHRYSSGRYSLYVFYFRNAYRATEGWCSPQEESLPIASPAGVLPEKTTRAESRQKDGKLTRS